MMVRESIGNVTVTVDILDGEVAPTRTVEVYAMTMEDSAIGI